MYQISLIAVCYTFFLYFCRTIAFPVDHTVGGKQSLLSLPIAERPTKLKAITGLPSHRNQPRQADLIDVRYERSFLTEVAFGGQKVDLIVDTGSSNTWVALAGFECEDGWPCAFGATVEIDASFKTIEGEHMNITYYDGSYINAIVGNDIVTIAGVTVPEQTVGFATLVSRKITGLDHYNSGILTTKIQAAFSGDGVSAGLVGMGYNSGTSIFEGTDPSTDSANNRISSSSIMNTIFQDGLTAPLFALAISRDASQTGFGGYLTIGSIPDISDPYVNASLEYASAPIQGGPGMVFGYEIIYESLAWDGGSGGSGQNATPANAIVDSGTIFIHIPAADDAAAVNALFVPPATLVDGAWQVSCDAQPPNFSVTVGGVYLPVNPADLIWYNADGGVCMSGIQSNTGITILGDPFLRSVLAVFDWGSEQIL
jgi:hypothetical protein